MTLRLFFGMVAAALIIGVAVPFVLWRPAHATELRCGTASFYSYESAGLMANGKRFNPNAMTAAMWGVPFGTVLIVQNVQNGRIVRVTITDRGPAKRLHRLIDLSRAAARALGMGGLARVCLTLP